MYDLHPKQPPNWRNTGKSKLLYAIGDSFTQGVGLTDPRNAWPFVIGSTRGYDVINEGYAGSSHDRIIRRAMTFISEWTTRPQKQQLVVMVGWGWTRRMEFYYSTDEDSPEEEKNYIRYTNMATKALHRYNNYYSLEFIKTYHEHFVNKNASTTRALTRILGLQSFLQQLRIPFLFFNSVWLPYKGGENPMAAMVDRKTYYGFLDQKRTFNNWTSDNGFDGRFDSGHPDAKAHAAWANHLSGYFRNANLWD